MQDHAPATPGATGDGAPEGPARAGAAVTLGHLIVIGLAVLSWLLVIDVRTDLATGWVDSAIYHSLFIDIWAIQDRFGDVYWLSRWPWVVTGLAAFSAFPPALASFVLTALVGWLFGTGLYALARQFVSPGAALATALIGATNLYVIQTGSAGYPSAMALALLMLAAGITVAGNRRDSVLLILIGGVVYGLAAMTHNYAAYLGFFLHLALLVDRLMRMPFRRVLRNEVVVLVAALLVVPLSIAVLYALGSSEEVFTTLGKTTQQAFQGQGGVFRKGPRLMLQEAGGYIVIVGGVVAVLVSLALSGWRWSAVPKGHRLAHLVFLAPLAAGIAFDILASGVTLQYGFYQLFQMGGALLQLGVLVDRAARGRSGVGVAAASVGLTAVGVLLVLFVLDRGYPTASVFGIVVGACALGCVVMLALCLPGRARRLATLVLPVFVALIASGGNFSRYSLMAHGQGVEGAPGIETVAWAMSMAKAHAGPEAPLFVAYDRGTIALEQTYPISNDRWYFTFRNQSYFFSIFDTIAGASLWGRGLVATTLDDFTATELRHVLANQGVAVVMVMWQQGEDPTNEVRRMIEEEQLFTLEAMRGVYRRPGAIPFNYAIVDVILPDPAVN